MMKKSCSIIPTHSPHFHFASEAVKSFCKNVNTDLFIVFSDQKDYHTFRAQYQRHGFNELILPKGFDLGKGIINRKKFYALEQLVELYEYVGVFDSETLFVKEMNTDLIYQEISDSKTFKSNRRYKPDHLRLVANFMGYDNNENLLSQTENFTQYWWFNEICVYNSEFFAEFYQWLKKRENYSAILREFACFDYLLYSIWLICNKGYTLKKYMQEFTFAGAAIETNYNNDDISYAFRSYQDRNIKYNEIDHIKVQIMVDRNEEHCRKEGGMKPFII